MGVENARVNAVLSNATSGSGACSPSPASTRFTVEVEWGTGTTAGTVVIETAPNKAWAGTWNTKASLAWVAANSVDEWRGDGPLGAIRVRIVSVTTTGEGITARVREA